MSWRYHLDALPKPYAEANSMYRQMIDRAVEQAHITTERAVEQALASMGVHEKLPDLVHRLTVAGQASTRVVMLDGRPVIELLPIEIDERIGPEGHFLNVRQPYFLLDQTPKSRTSD